MRKTLAKLTVIMFSFVMLLLSACIIPSSVSCAYDPLDSYDNPD